VEENGSDEVAHQLAACRHRAAARRYRGTVHTRVQRAALSRRSSTVGAGDREVTKLHSVK